MRKVETVEKEVETRLKEIYFVRGIGRGVAGGGKEFKLCGGRAFPFWTINFAAIGS